MLMMVSDMAFDAKPTNDQYPQWNASFRNQDVSPLDLVMCVADGFAYAPAHTENKRKKENWLSSQVISVDLENSPLAALDVVESNTFFSSYGFMAYTTLSHTDESPRSRAVFVLDKPFTSASEWHLAARAVVGFFTAADPCSSDISRAFLGNPHAQCRVYGRFLPMHVAGILAQQQWRLDTVKRDAERAMTLSRQRDNHWQEEGAGVAALGKWLDDLAHAPVGRRNNLLNRAAFLTGRYLVHTGKLSEVTALSTLIGAGLSSGLEELEVKRTVTQALRKGMSL